MQSSVYKNLSSRKKISECTLVKKHYKKSMHPLLIFTQAGKWEILAIVQRVLKNDPGSRKQANLQYEASTFQLIQLLKEKT